MNEALFKERKAALDAAIADLPEMAPVGIKLGWDLYREFRQRGLLVPKMADMILTKWLLWTYQDKFVFDSPDVRDEDFLVGKLDTRGPEATEGRSDQAR